MWKPLASYKKINCKFAEYQIGKKIMPDVHGVHKKTRNNTARASAGCECTKYKY